MSAPMVRYAFVKKRENAPKDETYELFIGMNSPILSAGEPATAGFFGSEKEALEHAENMGCEVRKPGETNPKSEEKKEKEDVKDSKHDQKTDPSHTREGRPRETA